MGIVWIASYPKSGNTWVRFLLANYLEGPIADSDHVERLIPGFNRATDANALMAERPVVYGKSHDRWGVTHPFVQFTDRSVFIVRHPKDVLLSNLNYRRIAPRKGAGFSDDIYVKSFLQFGGDIRWIEHGYGTLEQHTLSWLDAKDDPPRLLVRYEDLKADALTEFRRIVGFLGLPVDEERLAMAVRSSAFEQMRAIEVRERREKKNMGVWGGVAFKPGQMQYFVAKGRMGSTLEHISPALDRAFDERFGPLIERLGY